MAIETGNQGTVAIATITTGWTADVYAWALERIEKKPYEVTPMPRVNAPKYVLSSLTYAQGTIRFKLDSAVANAPMPSAAYGTVTLTTNGDHGYVIPAQIYNITVLGQSIGGAPWDCQASFIYSSEADTAITNS